MSSEIYRYQFSGSASISSVEELLLLAILAVECLHGASVVRLEAGYFLDEGKRSCVVDAGTKVGQDIARIFTGFLTRELGEEGFQVKKATDPDVKLLFARRRN